MTADEARALVAAAEERCETWKAQAARDQADVRELRARLAEKHAVATPAVIALEDHPDAFSTAQLVQFLREAAKRAKDGSWGMWRAKEFEQAAERLDAYQDSYLAVCPHEAEVEELKAALAKPEITTIRLLAHDWRNHGHWRGDYSVKKEDSFPENCLACAILSVLGEERIPSGSVRDWDAMEPILARVTPPEDSAR